MLATILFLYREQIMRGRSKDYVDPRFLEAPLRAAEILVEHADEWDSEIDAYWLLRRYEDKVGVPVTYDIVVEAIEIARRKLEAESSATVRRTSTAIEA
jgi:hypothetical protein